MSLRTCSMERGGVCAAGMGQQSSSTWPSKPRLVGLRLDRPRSISYKQEKELHMKKVIFVAMFAAFLSGCANTPENRALWQAIGEGMNSAGQKIGQDAAEMRQSLQENSRQQQLSRPINCVSTRDAYGTVTTTCY
jgi:predicted small secreted protein